MQIIQNQNNTFGDVIKTQKQADDTRYRLLTYSLTAPVEDGLLLYNTLSSEMILLQGSEIDDMLSLPYIRDNWFAVPDSFDDMKLVRQYRDIHQLFQKQSSDVYAYTILTTTDCNARCFYCYEMGRSRIPMTDTTANKVADYIIDNYNRILEKEEKGKEGAEKSEEKKHSVSLDWFGGEPLFNSRVIDIICTRLRDASVPYSSKMISNGYLFSDETVRKAVDMWKLRHVQITLDGTEKIYNRSKAFIYKEGSAFERVFANIGRLLDAGVRVTVRMNIDRHNADDLLALSDKLHDTYSAKEGLSAYGYPLFEESAGKRSIKRTDEMRTEVYQKLQQLSERLEAHGLLRSRHSLPKDIPTNLCMSDHSCSVVIAPTGQIGKCEHYSESEFFSDVRTPDIQDKAILDSFRERCEDIDICQDCPYYPLCIRLKKCEEGRVCFPQKRDQHIEGLRKAMLAKYDKWKKNQSETEENPDSNSDSNSYPGPDSNSYPDPDC